MMNKLPKDSVLIVVDVQQAFNDKSWGARNNPQAESNIAALLSAWRATQRPVIHVQHKSPRPESLFYPERVGFKVKPEATPLADEPVIFKSVNSSFIGTDLEERLRAQKASTLVIVGITTDHCVSTTTRMAGNFGFATYLVDDATATFERTGPKGEHYSAEQMHQTAIASLHGEFATIVDTESVLKSL